MINCFRCGKLIPGEPVSGEYVMCNECVKEWHKAGDMRKTEFDLRLSRMLDEPLKEQETEWEHLWDAPDGTFKGRCKKCGFVHFFIEGHDAQFKFCPACGKAVKWE